MLCKFVCTRSLLCNAMGNMRMPTVNSKKAEREKASMPAVIPWWFDNLVHTRETQCAQVQLAVPRHVAESAATHTHLSP